MALLDWFRRAPAGPPPEVAYSLDAHARRIVELETRVAKMAAIELAWADYEDRLSRHLAKLTKRDQRAAAPREQLDPIEEGKRIFRERYMHTNGGGA